MIALRHVPPGFRQVFCRYFTHYRTGKRVYPKKAKMFCFLVRCR